MFPPLIFARRDLRPIQYFKAFVSSTLVARTAFPTFYPTYCHSGRGCTYERVPFVVQAMPPTLFHMKSQNSPIFTTMMVVKLERRLWRKTHRQCSFQRHDHDAKVQSTYAYQAWFTLPAKSSCSKCVSPLAALSQHTGSHAVAVISLVSIASKTLILLLNSTTTHQPPFPQASPHPPRPSTSPQPHSQSSPQHPQHSSPRPPPSQN